MIRDAKKLLQHYRHKADMAAAGTVHRATYFVLASSRVTSRSPLQSSMACPLACLLDCLGIVGANQWFKSYEMLVAPDGIRPVFCHSCACVYREPYPR